jgi:amidase
MSYWYTYGSVINVLDYCSIVIPVTHVDANVDVFDADYKPVNEKDKQTWQACELQSEHSRSKIELIWIR